MCVEGGSKTGFVFLCYGKIPGLFQIFSRSAELFQGLGIRKCVCVCVWGGGGGRWGVKQGSSLLVRARFHDFSRYFQGLQSFFKVLVYGNVCVCVWGGGGVGSKTGFVPFG